MALSSFSPVVAVLSMAALMCISAATDAPKVTDILRNKELQVALGKAWEQSFLGNDLYQERGGWVYTDSNNLDKYVVVQLSHLQNAVQGTNHTDSCDIRLDNPEKDGVPAENGKNYKVVADFHTHPIPGQSQRPCSDDVSKAYQRGVPGIVVSCAGVFYYGPLSRDSMDGPTGYPQTSSEPYKGQKEVRFGDNTVDTGDHCKPSKLN